MAAHRYWRINSLTIPGGGFLEISELQFLEDGVDQTSSATKTSSSAPAFGALADIFDGSLSTRNNWTESVAENAAFWIKFDFSGGDKNINGVKQGGFDTSNRYMSAFTLQYSDNDTDWTSLGSKSGLSYPGNNTLSSLYSFEGPITGTTSLVFGELAAIGGTGALVAEGSAVFGHSADLDDVGAAKGVISVVLDQSVTLVGSGALLGVAAEVFSHTAVITGEAPLLAGVAAEAFADNATITGAAPLLAGVVSGVFGEAATAFAIGELSGAVEGSFTESVELEGSGALFGTAVGGFSTDSTLLGDAPLLAGSIPMVFALEAIPRGSGALGVVGAVNFDHAAPLLGAGHLSVGALLSASGSGIMVGSGALLGITAIVSAPTGRIRGLYDMTLFKKQVFTKGAAVSSPFIGINRSKLIGARQ